jgi:hypothetical protein
MRLVFSLALLGGLWAAALAQPPGGASMQSTEAHKLGWKFKPKDRFQVETTMQMLQLRRALGQMDAQDALQIVTTSTFTVQQVEADKSAVLQQKIEAVRYRMDGTIPASAAAAAELFTRLKGASFTLTLGPEGKVRKFEGYTEFIKRLDQQRPGDGQAFSQQVPEEDMKNASEEGFALFPDRPLRQGDTWERPSTVNLAPFGAIQTKLIYTLQAFQGSKARITFKHQGSEFKDASGRGADFVLEDRSGTIYFDVEAGRLISMDFKVRFNGRVSSAVTTQAGLVPMDFFQQQVVRLQVRSLR